ncbi:ThuA domain-containing protein [Seonamhaeicola sp. MEBiC1930]|uniref:ThuA domain-containing protein n=1 Tax=Seonamhaeicola sp. MEBiC01930 TaxID=2976768 RepID=UPI00324F39F0
MIKSKRVSFLLLILTSSLSFAQDKISVLVIDGYSNHDWRKTTSIVTTILEKTNLFTVEVTTAPANQVEMDSNLWKPKFKKYDVVIQNTNSYGNRPIWSRTIQLKLQKYVNSGGGLYILHSANNAFPEWEAYNQMIGMGWRSKDYKKSIVIETNGNTTIIPAGEGGSTSHGKRIDALLNKLTEHPINQGYPKQWKAADLEIYSYPRGPIKNLTVLSYAKEPKTQLNFPTEWVVNYGKGRVYNSTYGHVWKNSVDYPNSVRCIAFQTTLIRALEWLATKKVTWQIPSNFPNKDAISLEEF